MTGTIGGARLLNMSAPGIRFFQRQKGRYFPTPEARNIFEQINSVYEKMDDLTEIIGRSGVATTRNCASVRCPAPPR